MTRFWGWFDTICFFTRCFGFRHMWVDALAPAKSRNDGSVWGCWRCDDAVEHRYHFPHDADTGDGPQVCVRCGSDKSI